MSEISNNQKNLQKEFVEQVSKHLSSAYLSQMHKVEEELIGLKRMTEQDEMKQ